MYSLHSNHVFLNNLDGKSNQIYQTIVIIWCYNLGQNKKEQLTPFPPPNEGRRSKNAPCWHHWNGGRGGPDVPFILSKIESWTEWKGTIYLLPPLKAMMKARRSKNSPFWHHWNGGGRGGPDVLSILSKIVEFLPLGLWMQQNRPIWPPVAYAGVLLSLSLPIQYWILSQNLTVTKKVAFPNYCSVPFTSIPSSYSHSSLRLQNI